MPVRDFKPKFGNTPMAGKCKAEITTYMGGWPNYYQCSNKAHADGYCGTHNPEKVAAREAATRKKDDERFRKEVFESCYGRYGRAMAEALIKISEGDNDPRTTAREAVEAARWAEYGTRVEQSQ